MSLDTSFLNTLFSQPEEYQSRWQDIPASYKRTPLRIVSAVETPNPYKWVYRVVPCKVRLNRTYAGDGDDGYNLHRTTLALGGEDEDDFTGSNFNYVLDDDWDLPVWGCEGTGADQSCYTFGTWAVNGYEIQNTASTVVQLDNKAPGVYDSVNTITVKPIPAGVVIMGDLLPITNPSDEIPVDGSDSEAVTFNNYLYSRFYYLFSVPNPLEFVCGDDDDGGDGGGD